MSSVEAYDGADEIRRAWLAGLAPDPALQVSQWSDRHRILSSRGASEAGPYRTARTPYMRGIMDALSPSDPARRIVFMKAAQVGATEAGNNWVGFCMHRAPGPFLAVQPTVDLAKRLSQQRIDPLIEDSPSLRELVTPSRSRDSGNTILAKRFPGGQLILTGANSAVGLRSMPARWVFLDEVDAYPGDVDGEGDPIALAEARTNSFGHRSKIFLASTPTIKGLSRIEREWELSDQQRYHVPCPECGGLQWLKFERLHWEAGRPETAVYVCEHCEAGIAERHKTWMMAEENGADWIATAPPDVIAQARASGTIGFHISGLYSPLGWLSWEDIARNWEAAQGNDAALKTLKNTVLGETWQERGEAPDWQRLYERREDWDLGQVCDGALVLTAGADVQRDRIEIDVWGWGRNLRSWLVDHIVLNGDVARPEVWSELADLLGRTWPHASGSEMSLARLAVDTGDGMFTDAIYGWVRQMGRGQVIAVKGRAGFDRSMPVDGPSYVDTTEAGRKITGNGPPGQCSCRSRTRPRTTRCAGLAPPRSRRFRAFPTLLPISSRISVISKPSGAGRMQLSIFSSEELPASPSPSQASEKDWTTRAVTWRSSILPWLTAIGPNGWSGRMSPVSCRATADGILEPSSEGWGNSGMGGPTESLTLNSSEHAAFLDQSPSDGAVCSLSDILETGDLPQRYFLTAKACAGILRRAEKRGKELPPALYEALMAVATSPTAAPIT